MGRTLRHRRSVDLTAPDSARVVFGLFMWALGSGVAGPATKLAKPPWEYGATTNALEIGYHLAYGLGAAGTYRALERR